MSSIRCLLSSAALACVACGAGSGSDSPTRVRPNVVPVEHDTAVAADAGDLDDASAFEASSGDEAVTIADAADEDSDSTELTFEGFSIASLCAMDAGSASFCGDAGACPAVGDRLVVARSSDGGLVETSRTVGAGRHPVAVGSASFGVSFVETSAVDATSTVRLVAVNGGGAASAISVPLAQPSLLLETANPVVAALPCGTYAVAWTDAADGDELGIALSVVQPGSGQIQSTIYANTTTQGTQHDADVVWTGSQLVVAWVDDSNVATAPDLRFRTFDPITGASSAEQTLAATSDSEGDVALATFGNSWAAAWRDGNVVGDAQGVETVQVLAGSIRWTVGPGFLPGPVDAKPALVALDATHLAVAYAVGTDPAEAGTANGSKIQIAVLDAASPGIVTGVDVTPAVSAESGAPQSQPNLISANGTFALAWWTAAILGDPNEEELWIKPFGWNGTTLDLSSSEVPLPYATADRRGRQRGPALAAAAGPTPGGFPLGDIAAAWDDFGAFGTSEGNGDVVVQALASVNRGTH